MTGSDSTAGFQVVPVSPPQAVTMLNKKVMLATPWYKSVHPLTSFCVAQLMDRRRVSTSLCFGDAFVAHSRNSVADAFLKSDCEFLLMADDDMLLPFGNSQWFREHSGWKNYPDPFAGFNSLDRLLSHGKTLVGALYKGRYADANYVFAEGTDAKVKAFLDQGPRDEIRPTKWVGTGLFLVHRQVFLDIEKRFPRLGRGQNVKGGQWFSSSEHTAMDWIERIRGFLSSGAMTGEKAAKALSMIEAAVTECKHVSTLGCGEDVQFCLRATACGHQAFVDVGLRVGHLGCKVY